MGPACIGNGHLFPIQRKPPSMNLKYSMVATAIAIALASPVMPAHAQSAPIITQASSACSVIGQV